MKKLTIAVLLFCLPTFILSAQEPGRKSEFEVTLGATYGTRQIDELRNLPFLSFAVEWRRLFLDEAVATGVEGYLSAVPRKVLWEHADHESDYYSWRNLSCALTAEYRPFREGLKPFVGTAVGVTQTADNAPQSNHKDRGVVGLMIAPRIGVQPFRHFRLTAEFRWIPRAPEFNQVGARIGFVF